jgi:acetyltransferase-like isoleucine patch superfamily enzyme/acyl carrier protein
VTTAPPSPPTRRDLAQVVNIVRSFVRARVQLRGTRQGTRVRCHGRVLVPGRAGVEIGQRAVFLGGTIPTELRCQEGAELVIGPRSVLNYGVSIVAHRSVRIGTGCMIGSLVHIRDDDGRRTEPVTIGDGVWIAHGAVIEPGTTIGAGAVIGAMTVVSGTVPARSLATGNPAHHLPLEPASRRLGARKTQAAPSRHSRIEVRAAIVDWLDDTRHFGAAESLIRSDSMSLRAGGLLDSLGVVELVVMLEKRFGVRINRERVAHAGSQSMSSFVELVTGSRENHP